MDNITIELVRDFFYNHDDELIEDFLNNGLESLILELEQEDFFGTEGFNKRFA